MKIFCVLKHMEIEIKLSVKPGKVREFCFAILGDTLLYFSDEVNIKPPLYITKLGNTVSVRKCKRSFNHIQIGCISNERQKLLSFIRYLAYWLKGFIFYS